MLGFHEQKTRKDSSRLNELFKTAKTFHSWGSEQEVGGGPKNRASLHIWEVSGWILGL